jgi:FkbM family methyltransferase
MAAHCPGLAVESFEPSPRVHAKLARHAALNPALAVRLHRLALSDTNGTSLFHESAERFNAGVGALYAAHNVEAQAVAVEVARGDDLVAAGRAAAPTVIKIDVEGFELEVLGGLTAVLGRDRPALCVESAGPRLAERGRPLDAIARRLAELGYRVARIDEASGAEHPLRASDFARNIDLAAHPI